MTNPFSNTWRQLKHGLLIGLFATAAVEAADNKVSITIDPSQASHVINKNIYGQFAEHLGRGIYEGIWVGENSDIPNTNGFRNDVMAALKDLKVPVVRWPGGCFADEYHWREGIGPRNERPIKVNTHWGGVTDDNAFGTHEFFELAEMLGSDVYIAGNLGSGSPQEMAEWLEYMTSDSQSTLANLRRKNGRDKPWKVAFWGVGNESWGCGGNMRPEYYADLYRQYATFLKAPDDNKPKLIASGGHSELTNWTEVLTDQIKSNMHGISYHYYTLPTGNWDKKGAALDFDEQQWIATFASTLKMDGYIKQNVAIMDNNDPEGKVGLYVDEWGTWYDVSKGDPGFLYQQNSLRDALVAAVNFNIFHEHAERVHMTNIAQMVNVLQAMILTDKEKMLLTPTYYAFKMYIPFQDATLIPLEYSSPEYQLGDTSVPAISLSSAKTKDGKLVLAIANIDPNKAAIITTRVKGNKTLLAKGDLLSADKMDAHNSFEQPNIIRPSTYQATSKNGALTLKIPAKSILVVEIN
ncbi:alpha-L-arabinofuranosidase C-terminal domain-containing protein [Alteromonadaceae bacterium BrNp21-10]|nr:alpha-L-arabinofuranosidase C-terminal domain-containing protein [Alteromonadaceae bacterium BrNp21-10]